MGHHLSDRDEPPAPQQRRRARRTRDDLVAAARLLFSTGSYDAVGVRELATEADVDPAMISRHFGSKRGLFVAACKGAFDIVEHLPTDLTTIGAFLANAAAGEGEPDEEPGFNALSLLLLSSDCPEVAGILSATFRAEFIVPLAGRLPGEDTEERAIAIAACVIGLATVHHRLGMAPPAKATPDAAGLIRSAMQRLVTG
jgi:AcrR family transcriptional regulator